MYKSPSSNYLYIQSYEPLCSTSEYEERLEVYKNTLGIQTIPQHYLPYKVEVVTTLPDYLSDDTFYIIPEETV